jgi:hypothetical protein
LSAGKVTDMLLFLKARLFGVVGIPTNFGLVYIYRTDLAEMHLLLKADGVIVEGTMLRANGGRDMVRCVGRDDSLLLQSGVTSVD